MSQLRIRSRRKSRARRFNHETEEAVDAGHSSQNNRQENAQLGAHYSAGPVMLMNAGVQRKAVDDSQDENQLPVQAKNNTGAPSPTSGPLQLQAASSAGTPLPGQVRKQIEPALGADLDQVRVHNNAPANQAARSINAKAFTHGNHIYLGAGQRADDVKLMAHESTHVVQQAKSGPAVQAKKEEPFKVSFPDTERSKLKFAIKYTLNRIKSLFGISAKYPWQREEIRKTVYPHRETMLRQFLLTEYESALWDMHRSGTLEPYLKLVFGYGIEQASEKRGEKLKELTQTRKSSYKSYRRALKEKWAHMGRLYRYRTQTPEVVTAWNFKKNTSRIYKKLLLKLRNIKWTIQWYKRHKPSELEKFNTKQKALKAQLPLARYNLQFAQQLLVIAMQPYEKQRVAIKARVTSSLERHESAKAERKQLSKKRWAPKLNKKVASAVAWVLHKRRLELLKMDNKQLRDEVIRLFKQDPKGKQYPAWIRHMVIHFSGMRYASAHGSWASPHKLLNLLKVEDLKDKIALAPEHVVTGQAEDIAKQIGVEKVGLSAFLEIAKYLKLSWSAKAKIKRRIRRLERRHKTLVAPDQIYINYAKRYRRKRAELENLAFLTKHAHILMRQIDDIKASGETASAELALLSDALISVRQSIRNIKKQLPKRLIRRIERLIKWSRMAQSKAVLKHQIEEADAEINALSEPYALALLDEVTKDAPAWVRRLVISRTGLRLTAKIPKSKTGPWWDLSWKDYKARAKKDSATRRWKRIMWKWQKDVIAWRAKHASSLSIVVLRAVCNEIAEHALHARGLKPTGGLTGKTQWYFEQQAKTQGAFFKRASEVKDIPPGASIFWKRWTKEKPHRWSLAKPIPGMIEGNERTVNGEKEWLKWTHEAVVYRVVNMGGKMKVITFETTKTGAGIRERTMESIKKPSVYIGYVPSKKPHKNVDKKLLGIKPNKNKK